MASLTLLRQGHPLADAARQREILATCHSDTIPEFQSTLEIHSVPALRRSTLRTLQVNVGKLCNQTCRHCHVDAGPDRRELMSKEVFEHCLRVIDEGSIETVDLTGGAPEMNPHFEWFVSEVRSRNCRVTDRCNLTILTAPGYTHLPEFLAQHEVEVVASLPCYLEENCDTQRGEGVFQKSVQALQILNRMGYAADPGNLTLSLVYNPVGAILPPDQRKLEQSYRQQLKDRYDIRFNHLYAITNMPISRFLDDLLTSGRYEHYMQLLVNSFNPDALEELMCRTTLSVDWQGYLFDCDFNQMLDLPISTASGMHIREYKANLLSDQPISVGRHCYGCTAGAGSSCQGALLTLQ
ncbi:MAG: arsenosugar biosynthesis radical SAM protein ArsS [Planctomycetaceae bacterium]|nr:arsenosugar biosynthesis radical SAM protein ArsS [Planctomycetaceae bacterium]